MVKIKYTNTDKNEYFQLDVDSYNVVGTFMEGRDAFVFDTRKPDFFINLPILFRTIFFTFKFFNLKSGYLTALIKSKTSYACITCTDNSIHFHHASRELSSTIRMVAIQNGIRMEYKNWPEYRKNGIHISEFICFGHHDVGFVRKLGATIKSYHPVGSLKVRKFLNQINNADTQNPKPDLYDICFICDDFQDGTSFIHSLKKPSEKSYCGRRNIAIAET